MSARGCSGDPRRSGRGGEPRPGPHPALLLGLVRATLRTNTSRSPPTAPEAVRRLQAGPAEGPRPAAAPAALRDLGLHPRVEGVHLRFGAVARGGLRWSDRREDFRTEVLGLVKAQMVKNAVIVPVGAKGGFVVKRPPADPTDREAWSRRGHRLLPDLHQRAARRHRQPRAADGQREVVPPPHVVRHDGDDAYLVVAADKGTATFSDIANQVALDYGFWLGDAFASGGSVGYDHKAMGITARGAWESVKRHFRELGVDTQAQDFTVVGVGDMSGDVFGNGMLLSEHIRLVAAFDHRHVFLDPDPDPAVSFAERRRLFDLPRSSWADYDPSLISAGGGVYPRTAKSMPYRPAGARAARPRRRGHQADAGRTDQGRSCRAGRPALERRHRHLRQGDVARPTRMSGTRPTTRSGSTAQLRAQRGRRGRQPRPDPAGRIEWRRRMRRPHQHRRDRQQGRGGLLRPRGQHQDPAGRGRPRGGLDAERAQRAARRDDRRRRAARARDNNEQNILLGNARAQALDAPGAPAVHHARSRARRLDRAWRTCRATNRSRTGCAGPGSDLAASCPCSPPTPRSPSPRPAGLRPAGRTVVRGPAGLLPAPAGRAFDDRSTATRCAARSHHVGGQRAGQPRRDHLRLPGQEETGVARGDRSGLHRGARGIRPRRLGPRSRRSTASADRRPDDALPEAAGCSTGRPGGSCRPGPSPGRHGGSSTSAEVAALLAGCLTCRRRRAGRLLHAGRGVPGLGVRRSWPAGGGCSTRSRCWTSSTSRRPLSCPHWRAAVYFASPSGSGRRDVDRITALPRDDRWSALARMALRYDLYAALAELTSNVLTFDLVGRRAGGADRLPGSRPNSEGVARAQATLGEIIATDHFRPGIAVGGSADHPHAAAGPGALSATAATARAASSSVRSARAVRRSRETPSGTDGRPEAADPHPGREQAGAAASAAAPGVRRPAPTPLRRPAWGGSQPAAKQAGREPCRAGGAHRRGQRRLGPQHSPARLRTRPRAAGARAGVEDESSSRVDQVLDHDRRPPSTAPPCAPEGLAQRHGEDDVGPAPARPAAAAAPRPSFTHDTERMRLVHDQQRPVSNGRRHAARRAARGRRRR